MNTQLPKDKLYLKVIDPEKVHFEGEVTVVSSVNQLGPFDILPAHENFISIIKEQVIIYTEEGKQRLEIDRGILKVESNKIQLFIGIGMPESVKDASDLKV